MKIFRRKNENFPLCKVKKIKIANYSLNPEIASILFYLFFTSLADFDKKNIEHQETVNQVKKLTQQFNIQSTPSKKKDKPHTAFFM